MMCRSGVGQLGGARLPKCLSELDKLYDVCKNTGENADWPPSRWDGAGMFSGRIFRNRCEYLYADVGHALGQRLGGRDLASIQSGLLTRCGLRQDL